MILLDSLGSLERNRSHALAPPILSERISLMINMIDAAHSALRVRRYCMGATNFRPTRGLADGHEVAGQQLQAIRIDSLHRCRFEH